MKFGVFYEGMNPAALTAIAQKAEALGFESLWRPDHLVLPAELPNTYPYAPDGKNPLDPKWPIADTLTVLTWAAAVTSTIKLGTTVYILPLRHPIVTARSVLGIDFLSKGRVLFGVGAGWLEEEFEIAGQDFHTRGARMDEIIAILRKLWTEPTITHAGEHYHFGPLHFEPKPVAKPHPPIIVGGESPAALRRAGRLGDGWYGVRHGPEAMASFKRRLDEQRERYGRLHLPFEITVNARADLTVDDVRRFEEVGVDRLVIQLYRSSKDAIPNLERFAEAVL
ncbi:MAG: LLM class F420-dependent oxidoreductase, partial [Dehalococcoidia bacterium]